MSVLRHAIHHPRKLWLRRAVFQVHLWAGVFLTLYLVLIALTGSVLVFRSELTGTTLPRAISRRLPPVPLPVPDIVAGVTRAYPGIAVDAVTAPTPDVPAYLIQTKLADGRAQTLLVDPANGALYTQGKTWVQWVYDLHVYLLLPQRFGMQVNGAGAAILLLLTVTGLVLWWPGLRVWTRGLRVNLRANWRRINYDLHSAIGFWTLALVSWWAVSGLYFGFYRQITIAVNFVSPLRNMIPPASGPIASPGPRVPLATLLSSAQTASPRGHLFSISNLTGADSIAYVAMDLAAPGDFLHRDIIRVDTTSGHVLSIWHYAEKHSLGDWILWLMHPLHFGSLWGLAVKVVWFAGGLALAALAVTGLLMYWNRFLRPLLRRP